MPKVRGVIKDNVEAYKWLNLALDQSGRRPILEIEENMTPAQIDLFNKQDPQGTTGHKLLADLESEMTPGQIAKAKQLVLDFKPVQASSSK